MSYYLKENFIWKEITKGFVWVVYVYICICIGYVTEASAHDKLRGRCFCAYRY